MLTTPAVRFLLIKHSFIFFFLAWRVLAQKASLSTDILALLLLPNGEAREASAQLLLGNSTVRSFLSSFLSGYSCVAELACESEEWTTRGGSLETVKQRGLFAWVWMWVRQLRTELCISPFRHCPVICSAANPLPP